MLPKRIIRLTSKSPQHQLLVQSLLELVENKLTATWEYVEDDDSACDVLVVDVDNHYLDVALLRQRYGVQRLVAYSNQAKPAGFDTYWDKPVRPLKLITWLNELNESMSQTKTDNNELEDTVRHQAKYDALAVLAQIMDIVQQHKFANLSVILDGEICAYVDTYRKAAYLNAKFLNNQISHTNHVVIELLRAMPKLPEDFSRVCLIDFFYRISASNPTPALMPPLSLKQHSFKIKQWPSIDKTPYAKFFIQASVYWSKQKATLAVATQALNTDVSQLIHFLNAVNVSGLLAYEEVEVAPPVVPSIAKNDGLTSLFGRIRKKFGLA